jgi:hypothetical protein
VVVPGFVCERVPVPVTYAGSIGPTDGAAVGAGVEVGSGGAGVAVGAAGVGADVVAAGVDVAAALQAATRLAVTASTAIDRTNVRMVHLPALRRRRLSRDDRAQEFIAGVV